MIKLEHLRMFLAVADARSLAAAGDRVGRTPAALSLTLKQIEEELGGPLFEGERKGLLTPLGAYALAQARRALMECDGAVASIRQYAQGESGFASIAAVPSAAIHLIPIAVRRVRNQRPRLRVELRDIDSAAVCEAVLTGSVDFGIATPGKTGLGLTAEPLVEDAFVLVCKPSHGLARRKRPIRWNDIDAAEFISNGLCARIAAAEAQALDAQARLNVRNTTSLLHFVEQGFGVTLLPALAIPPGRKLCAIRLADGSATRKLDLLTRTGVTPSPAASALLQAVREARKALRM